VSCDCGSVVDAVRCRRNDGHHTNVSFMVRSPFRPDYHANGLPLRSLIGTF
jgi:hypothetical protein